MRKWVILAVGLMTVVVAADIFVLTRPHNPKAAPSESATPANKTRNTSMKLTSTAFTPGNSIPARYTCQGDNVNPPLTIDRATEESQALALVLDDPDAPGGTFVHWVMWNLPVSVTEIGENWTAEQGVSMGANSSGKPAYMGPCPPSGTHHYHFKLYALDQKLELAAGSDKSTLEKAMAGHIVGQAELIGTYAKH
jgi:Raf kinase inhibitor-like YbhB/YbcL family protein